MEAAPAVMEVSEVREATGEEAGYMAVTVAESAVAKGGEAPAAAMAKLLWQTAAQPRPP